MPEARPRELALLITSTATSARVVLRLVWMLSITPSVVLRKRARSVEKLLDST